MKKIIILSIMMIMILGFSMQADANLQKLRLEIPGYQLIYDTDLDITWHDYVNATGTWKDHIYLASVSFIDFESSTHADWRLPSTLDDPLSYVSEKELSDSPSQAWRFSLYIGQELDFTGNGDYGIGVRNGDVAATVDPEPISSTTGGPTFGFAFHKEF